MSDNICNLPKPTGPVALSATLSVGPAPSREGLKALAAAGFKSVINNRPDSDQSLTMTSTEAAAEAANASLEYVHIPVEGNNPLEKDIKAFSQALRDLPAPIFAYCQLGGRSASLWALASVSEADTDELIAKCRDIGFDISGLRTKMDMRRKLLSENDDD